jgi:hypothetical protein
MNTTSSTLELSPDEAEALRECVFASMPCISDERPALALGDYAQALGEDAERASYLARLLSYAEAASIPQGLLGSPELAETVRRGGEWLRGCVADDALPASAQKEAAQKLASLLRLSERIGPSEARTRLDLRDPRRREIVVGVLSERIGKMADGMGWESSGNANTGPQDAAEVVVYGIDGQRGYLERLERVGDLHRPLLAAALSGAPSIELPADLDWQVVLTATIEMLHEAMHHETPTDDIASLLAGLQEAERWLAELQGATPEQNGPAVSKPGVLTVDLMVPWRREILAHMLVLEYSAIAERVSVSVSDDAPDNVALDDVVARGLAAVLGPWLDAARPARPTLAALEILTDPSVTSLELELPRERLIVRLKDVVLFLGEVCVEDGDDDGDVIKVARRAARAWLDELEVRDAA